MFSFFYYPNDTPDVRAFLSTFFFMSSPFSLNVQSVRGPGDTACTRRKRDVGRGDSNWDIRDSHGDSRGCRGAHRVDHVGLNADTQRRRNGNRNIFFDGVGEIVMVICGGRRGGDLVGVVKRRFQAVN